MSKYRLTAFVIMLAACSYATAQEESGSLVKIQTPKEFLVFAEKEIITAAKIAHSKDKKSNETLLEELKESRTKLARVSSYARAFSAKLKGQVDLLSKDLDKNKTEIANINTDDDLKSDVKLELKSESSSKILADKIKEAKDEKPKLESQVNAAAAEVDAVFTRLFNFTYRSYRDTSLRRLRGQTSEADRSLLEQVANNQEAQAALRTYREKTEAPNLRIRDISNYLAPAQSILTRLVEIERVGGLKAELEGHLEAIGRLETEQDFALREVDDKLAKLIERTTSDTSYTWIATTIFGFAVLIVIGSFFALAHRSKTARETLFVNDSGLQFVTLFSLVIAIILFGVLKILEAKELAALLGGLSGYILGRGSISRTPSTPGTPPQDPAAPAAMPPAAPAAARPAAPAAAPV